MQHLIVGPQAAFPAASGVDVVRMQQRHGDWIAKAGHELDNVIIRSLM
jgi:hypothetical protein